MFSVKILAGELESTPITIAHKDIATLFSDAHDVGDYVEILGSHSGEAEHFGAILIDGDPVGFYIGEKYTAHVFNPDDFLGISYIKFRRSQPSNTDLEIWIHYRTF